MRKADNLPPYRAVVMKSVSLNFLEPSGPAQACYGRTLPFTYYVLLHVGRNVYDIFKLVILRNIYVMWIFGVNSIELAVYFASLKAATLHWTAKKKKYFCSTVSAVLYFQRSLSRRLPWQHLVRSRVCTNLIYKIVTITWKVTCNPCFTNFVTRGLEI